ncbi:viral A-type inclusion protein repeat-containing domain protein [Dictyocaulus viviparus]|uniref:Viral A-type inclusion protein repeat-containing domain protein n=1 Tax=Dictyocaulus viviparus TaxID=29172 RepID=A0A0D8XM84_DICVI|nr:viral A-type inclusion protein repeat-containing domain protein [Dictyocaulus viviparus]
MAHYSEVGLDSTGRPHVSLSLSEEYEQLKADYQASIEKLNQTMNSIRTFWSPELKKERQMRREVERLLQTPGTSPGTVQETGHPGLTDMRIRELENTIIQLQEMLKISEQQILDPTGRIAFENALRVVDEKQAQINELQDELSTLRINRTSQPRDFTDKTITNHEMITLRMKMERSEMELSEKKTELAQSQARMRAAEEQVADLRQHVHLLKEQITNREQQHTLLQGDVDALRQKLEGKNQQMEHRDRRIERLENELSDVKGELSEKNEQLQQSCHRISQMMGRIDGLETSLREKEVELDNAKIRLSSHPDVIKENDLKEKLESITIEKKRLQEQMDQLRRNTEKERIEQQETYQVELQQLRCNIESLQKELSDRDVFLESQNEKIGDMDRELTGAQQCLQAVMGNKGKDELRREVESARNEVEKLLKMVRQLEKENTHLSLQCKQLQSTIDRGNGDGGSSSTLTKDCIHGEVPSLLPGSLSGAISAQAKRRIEELEEALRESVSITAEREVHLSQQKHLLHQVNQQLNDARRENAELRRRVTDCWSDDHEHLMKALELERQQHIEQLSQLKKEALLVAVAEKDEHIDYLEKSRAPREEIEIIRRHKDALLRKLKQENEHRSVVVRSEATNNVVQTGPPAITVGNPASFVSQSAHQDIATADMDDSEGIWA